jgi:hypothetical protein
MTDIDHHLFLQPCQELIFALASIGCVVVRLACALSIASRQVDMCSTNDSEVPLLSWLDLSVYFALLCL